MQADKEFIYTKQDYKFLKQLAEQSGGEYYRAADYKKLKDDLPVYKRMQRYSAAFELWNRFWVLILIIGLLALEWFIRKRKGLA